MRKIILIVLFLIISNNVYANGKILKSGFISKSASVKEGINIKDPKNKIIIIYNHGQNTNDKALKNQCIWVNQIRNQASLVGEEINGKKIFFEKEFDLGDIIIYDERTIHGVDEIDIKKNLNLNNVCGRLTAFVSLYKNL